MPRGHRARPAPRSRRSGGKSRRPKESPPVSVREAALRILQAVDTRSVFSDRLLDSAHAQTAAAGGEDASRDQALLHELVKGTLRWRGRLDHVLDRLVHIGIIEIFGRNHFYGSSIPIWVLLLGRTGIVAGLASYGYKVIRTISSEQASSKSEDLVALSPSSTHLSAV